MKRLGEGQPRKVEGSKEEVEGLSHANCHSPSPSWEGVPMSPSLPSNYSALVLKAR